MKRNGNENYDLKEGINEINIYLLENEKKILEKNYKIFSIIPYQKQFNDENTNKGTVVHYLNGQWEKYEETSDLLINSGIKNIRTTFSWNDIEVKYGNYDYSYYDKWIKKLNDNNINIIASINRITNYSGEDKIISNEEEEKHFLKFYDNLISRYPFINDYQFINEPDLNGYDNEEKIRWYAKTFDDIFIRKKNTIIGGISNSSSANIKNKEYYDLLFKYSNNIFNVATHIYDYENQNKQNEKFIKTNENFKNNINSNGGFVNKYLTEYGIHTANGIDDISQAQKILQQTVLGDKYNYTKVIQYNFWSTGNDKTFSENNFGLITCDYKPRVSYYVMKNYYENTNGAEYIGQINIKEGLEAHVYDKDGKPKIIVWSTDTNSTSTIDYTDFKASDLYGKEIENTNGKLEITTAPIYLDNISNKYFYQAIANTITIGYNEFNEKFSNEIERIPELKTEIANLNTFAEKLTTTENLDENIAELKTEEHFNLGSTIINAYNNEKLNIEYVKLSSMLDYLNTIGNAYEDLITVSAKTRITDLSDITSKVEETKNVIENNSKVDIVYPNKIYKFSKDLLEASSYVLNLEEENDIKTGLINSKAIHAKYLAEWSKEFSEIYVKDWLKSKTNDIKEENYKIYNENKKLSTSTKINERYNELIDNLNDLVKQTKTDIPNETINNIYEKQFELINIIEHEYNTKQLDITESEYETTIIEFIEVSDKYKDLFNAYITEDDIPNDEIKDDINKIIDIYNDNNDINMSLCVKLINNIKDIYNNNIQNQTIAENYLNKRRIQNTCTIISKMLENKIKTTAQQESQSIVIEYSANQNTLTNQDVSVQIKLSSSKCVIENNPDNEKYTFAENGTKNIEISIRGYKYNYEIKVTNIDKKPPEITGIEPEGRYKQSVKPQITDENLSEVKLIKDGQEVENYQANTTITQEGIYQLIAKDKAGNETTINFVIAYPEDEKIKIENNTIKNIKGETKVTELKEKLQVSTAYTIKRQNTEIEDTENIATGDILETEDGTQYTLIVKGDINKDGKVDVKDLVKMRRYMLLGNNLDENEKIAADTNLDGKEISVRDLVKMRIILLTSNTNVT